MQASGMGWPPPGAEEAFAAHAALQSLGWGVIVLDRGASICYANPSAQRALRSGGVLRMDGDRLGIGTGCAQQARAFRTALAGTLQGLRSVLRLGSGRTVRMLALVPMQPGPCAPAAQAALPDPGQRTLLIWAPDEQLLQSSLCLYAVAHGLTGSERDVLEALCQGQQAPQIADSRMVTLHTVRSQIRSIRSKLGARSVNEVIASALSVPPLSPLTIH